MGTTGLRRVVEAAGYLCLVGCLTSMGRAENGPSGSTPAADRIKIRCECSQLANDGAACRDITGVLQSEIVTWYEQAYPPPNPDFDWDDYCFRKKAGYDPAAVCCDHLEDGEARYYRGTVLP